MASISIEIFACLNEKNEVTASLETSGDVPALALKEVLARALDTLETAISDVTVDQEKAKELVFSDLSL